MIAALLLVLYSAQAEPWVLLADPSDTDTYVGGYATQHECNAARGDYFARMSGPDGRRLACVYGGRHE